MPAIDERLLSPGQAASILGVHRDTIAVWVGRGRIPCATQTPGGHHRYRAADVERLRVELGRPAVPPPARTPHPPPTRNGRNRELLSAGQVAALVDVDIRTVRRWAEAGFLPAATLTPGGHRRWRREDVERFAAEYGLAQVGRG